MWRILALCMVLASTAPMARADVFGFFCITNNSAACAAYAPQLTVNITDAGGGQVLFTFNNAGPLASSITDVYFDDGTLLGIANVINGLGVDFSQLASPPDLPAGNSLAPAFQTTAGFSANSNPPVQPNGVNPSESVGILFDLLVGLTFADTIDAMGTGELRIGIHLQGLDGGFSESLVTGDVPPQIIPEPTSVVLLGTTLLGVCHLLRKRFATR